MRLAAYTSCLLVLMLFAHGAVQAKDKKQDDKKKAAKDDKKKPAEKQGTDELWTADEVKDFLKKGIEVTYNHREHALIAGHITYDKPTMTVNDADDKQLKITTVEFELAATMRGTTCKPIEMPTSMDWETARSGAFNRPIRWNLKMTVSDDKLKVGGKSYKCKLYTYDNGAGTKEKWWLAPDLPGIVLQYQMLTKQKVMGVVNNEAVYESYLATKLDIPKTSKKPAKKKKHK